MTDDFLEAMQSSAGGLGEWSAPPAFGVKELNAALSRAETAGAEVARLTAELDGARADIARLLNALDSAAETMREKCLAAAQEATEQHPGDPHRLIQAIYSVLMSEVMAEALSEE